MFSIIGMALFAIISIMTILTACGLPLGEFTMGGQHRILPKKYRIFAAISFIVQLFAIIIILQAGGFVSLWFSVKITKYICIVFAVYLLLNVVMNILSKSKKEKFVMAPLSLIAAICFWITAFRI